MTKRHRKRRHNSWLKWSLAVLCLTFVIFYIPSFLNNDSTAAGTGERLATVDGRPVSVSDFRRRYLAQANAVRAKYGSTFTDAKLQQMQLPQEILQQMITETVEAVEAERAGVTVSDEDVWAQIMATPGLQENGHFIGKERYHQMVGGLDPPMTPSDFEKNVRQTLIFDRFRAGLTEWISISDAELEHVYRLRNDKVTLDVVAILADKFQNQVTPTDADIAAKYNANKHQYEVPEQRKLRFVRINTSDIVAGLKIPREDVERYYSDHVADYTTPDQLRASHILLKIDGKNEAEIRARAQGVLQEAKAGADFAALARKYSEDDPNAQRGGDLGYFARGRMVPEFETAAFAMAPGEISGLVKTQFGFHIIKVTGRKPGIARNLNDPAVYKDVEAQVLKGLAGARLIEAAAALSREGTTPELLEKAAVARGLKMEESDFFSRGGLVPSLDIADPVSDVSFEMADTAVSEPTDAPFGEVIFYVSGKRAAFIPKLEDVRGAVRDDVIRERAMLLAKEKGDEVAARLKAAPDFQKSAKAAGLEVVRTQSLGRDAVIPNVGKSPAIDAAAFALPVGGVSNATVTPRGAAIVKLDSKQEVSPADYAAAHDTFLADELNQRRMRFYQSYMDKARAKMKIVIDNDALKRASG